MAARDKQWPSQSLELAAVAAVENQEKMRGREIGCRPERFRPDAPSAGASPGRLAGPFADVPPTR